MRWCMAAELFCMKFLILLRMKRLGTHGKILKKVIRTDSRVTCGKQPNKFIRFLLSQSSAPSQKLIGFGNGNPRHVLLQQAEKHGEEVWVLEVSVAGAGGVNWWPTAATMPPGVERDVRSVVYRSTLFKYSWQWFSCICRHTFDIVFPTERSLSNWMTVLSTPRAVVRAAGNIARWASLSCFRISLSHALYLPKCRLPSLLAAWRQGPQQRTSVSM